MKQVNWGIIGCGNVTEVKSGPAFNNIAHSNLKAVMRRNATKAKDYADRHGVPKWYSNADDLIHDPEVNAIYVATPPSSHKDYAIKAMRAGKPVYVEKPMALNYEECQEMITVSEETKVPLFVAYYRRALPSFVKVKQLLDQGIVGNVKMVNITLHKALEGNVDDVVQPWRVVKEQAGGGHFFDLASHQLDLMDFFFGTIIDTKAIALRQSEHYDVEDVLSASFLLGENVLINGSWCFTVPEYLEQDTIGIIGSKGKIVFSCFGFSPVELVTEGGVEVFDFQKPKHVQQNFIEIVVDRLMNNEDIITNAQASANTSRVLDKVVEAYYKKDTL